MTTTKTDRLREAIADDIVSGRLAAGSRLEEIRLAGHYGVSRTPVREALRQLASTGLVRFSAHRGAVVAPLSDGRITDMFVAVAEIEAACAGLCAVNMTPEERYRLEELHRQSAAVVRNGDAEAYHHANVAFHAAIHQGCHNPMIVEMAMSLRGLLAPLSRVQFRGEGRLARSHAEHEIILQSILRGDRERALSAMRNHLAVVERAFRGYADAATGAVPEQAAE